MKQTIIAGISITLALVWSGCATGDRLWPEGTLAPTEDPVGSVSVRVESIPAGALITSGGVVWGHAPVRVDLPVTRHGFFPSRTRVKARFGAEDESFGPVTVTAEFGPMDRVPPVIVFNPHGFMAVRR
jgi:hypothetical protein